MSRIIVVSAFMLFLCDLSFAQLETLYSFMPPTPQRNYGAVLDLGGDVDGDCLPDILVGNTTFVIGSTQPSTVEIFSSATGQVIHTFTDPAGEPTYGASAAMVGDLNGDGRSEILIGSPGADFPLLNGGSVYVYSGIDQSLMMTLDGQEAAASFGTSISALGDINADGIDDFMISAPLADPNGNQSGEVTVFSGADFTAIYTFTGSLPNEKLGSKVNQLGDLNGDGIPEFGARRDFVHPTGDPFGAVRIWSGATGNVLFNRGGKTSLDGFGDSFCGLGDIDGDGQGDFIVTRPSAGGARGGYLVYSGDDGSVIFDVESTLQGERRGTSVAASADANGDGVPDIVIGSQGTTEFLSGKGRIQVLSGADLSIIYQIDGILAEEGLGRVVTKGMDLNLDGRYDLIHASRQFGSVLGRGQVRFLTEEISFTAGLVLPLNLQGGQASAEFGTSVAALGDLDGDGVNEILVGAPGAEVNGIASGQAHVFSGRDQTTIYQIDGSNLGDRCGASVANMGDLDGDGLSDFAVGSPAADANGVDSGRVEIFSGATGASLMNLSGAASGEMFGQAISGQGRIDSDGVPDFLISADRASLAGPQSGRIEAFSGATGASIYSLNGLVPMGRFGFASVFLGDVDADGFDDFLVGAPEVSLLQPRSGYIQVVSGATGITLLGLLGDPESNMGYATASGRDLNGDGVNEFVVGAPNDPALAPEGGSFRVYDGQTFIEIARVQGSVPHKRLGYAVAMGEDFNLDGVGEICASAPFSDGASSTTGVVSIYSGRSRSQLMSYSAASAGGNFGSALTMDCDLNLDGIADVLVAAKGDDTPIVDAGSLHGLFPRINFGAPYFSNLNQTNLSLKWEETVRQGPTTRGDIRCVGASAFGQGILGVSWAPTDLFFGPGLSLLIANDPINLIESQMIQFDGAGEFLIADYDRRAPLPAGSVVYLQCFEINPVVQVSNGLRLELLQDPCRIP